MNFSQNILNWYHIHGRKTLPWKKDNNIYKIWISEIMLQRTQVKTVIPYYIKFIKIFPNIKILSQTKIETILYFWSGLGFYQRAHNIHKTAKIIQIKYQGIFPTTVLDIKNLPGIGKSTAHAILSFSKNFCYPILDSNIKRLLTRYNFCLKKNFFSQKKLWNIINQLIPAHHASKFNQGMMDLGSLICKYKKPLCILCPLKESCNYNKTKQINHKKLFQNICLENKKVGVNFLIIHYKNFVLLRKNNEQKFWKSLFIFPLHYFSINLKIWKNIKKIHHANTQTTRPFIHYFSHITLYINSYNIFIKKKNINNYSQKEYLWYDIYNPQKIGIPTPVSKLIKNIKKNGRNIMKKIKSRTIFCSYFKKNAIGLDYPFYPGEIGQKIYNEISQEAWQEWIKKQTKIINEKKLNMFLEKDRKILENEMIKFLF